MAPGRVRTGGVARRCAAFGRVAPWRRRRAALLLAACMGAALAWAEAPASASLARAQPAPSCTVPEMLAQLTTEQRVGQLFMVGLSSDATADEIARTNETISTHHAGNVVLYGTGWNGSSTIRATARPLQALARGSNAGIGLFISGNQEGGQWGAFQAFYGPGFSPIPSPIYQAQGDPTLLQEQARIWGEQLGNAGVNLNLAPVLDTVPYERRITNDPIGFWGREYGYDPEHVTTYGVAFARGMREGEEAVSIKHFPGLGRVTGNTDFTAEGIEDTEFSGLDDPYIQPYKAAIDAGVEFVMMSSAVYSRVDARRALFSSVMMDDILRRGLGFQNIIITDDVGAAAALADLSPPQRAVDFFQAGGDMVLTILASDIAPMAQGTLAVYVSDPDFKARIDASVERVLRVKAGTGLLPRKGAGC